MYQGKNHIKFESISPNVKIKKNSHIKSGTFFNATINNVNIVDRSDKKIEDFEDALSNSSIFKSIRTNELSFKK
jgi:hypothetical protein